MSKYLGKWYEIARFDHSFERDMQNVTAEERMIRIQKIKKMMETEEGINQLASFLQIQLMNSNQEYSQTNNTSNYSINKEGQLVLMKNPALNAQVD